MATTFVQCKIIFPGNEKPLAGKSQDLLKKSGVFEIV
jgi:hypothetical protein